MSLPVELIKNYFSTDCWYLIFSITTLCNQRCKMCYNREMDTPDLSNELTIPEISKIAANFNNLYQLTLSGGEPTLRKDIVDIVAEFSRNKPIPRITLPSNGQNPHVLQQIVQELAQTYPYSNINVALSLDGIGAVHDKIRGVPGAFDNHLESRQIVDELRKKYPNVSLVIATTISSYNVNSINDILEHIKSDPSPGIYGFMLARGVTREKDAADLSTDQFIEYAIRLHNIQQQSSGGSKIQSAVQEQYFLNRMKTIKNGYMVDPCKAGHKLLILNQDGNLWPCEMLMNGAELGYPPLDGGWKFGNFRDADYNLKKLLFSRQAVKIRDYIQKRKCQCSFECALINNYALNFCNLPRIAIQLLKRTVS